MFWTEKEDCWKLIHLTDEQVSPLPLSYWTTPAETDPSILMSQFRCLLQGGASLTSSLTQKIAVSHLSNLLNRDVPESETELTKFKLFLVNESEKNILVKQLLAENK